MISYYELLKRIEKGDIPEKIKVHLTNTPRVYKADYDGSDFSHYFIYDGETDEDYPHYLAECFLESDMFDLNIEIIEEEKKIPEKLEILNANEHSKEVYYENYSKEEISLDIETLQNWVNKIIDYLKSKGE